MYEVELKEGRQRRREGGFEDRGAAEKYLAQKLAENRLEVEWTGAKPITGRVVKAD